MPLVTLIDEYKTNDIGKYNMLKCVLYYYPSIKTESVDNIKLMLAYPNETWLVLDDNDYGYKLLDKIHEEKYKEISIENKHYVKVADLLNTFYM